MEHNLYFDQIPQNVPVVNNTIEALKHYYTGKGVSAFPGEQTMHDIMWTKKFREKHNILISGKQEKNDGFFNVDLNAWNTEGNNATFHVGNIQYSYAVTSGKNANLLTYKFFIGAKGRPDGFWDANYIYEKSADKWEEWHPWLRPSSSIPDGKGPNLELPGGTPYSYLPSYRFYLLPPQTK
jgi:hypothetical protein